MEPDVLPGSRFLYLLMHVSMVKDMAGVYGSEGGVMPAAQTRHRRYIYIVVYSEFIFCR